MALGINKPVASINGLPCSGHGIPIPATIHMWQSCGTPPIPLSIIVKDKTCMWPPMPLIPLTAINPLRATVLVNFLPIMIFGDMFTPHTSFGTNIINFSCPCGKAMCIIPTPTTCSMLSVEDMGGVGHARLAEATTLSVYAFKVPVARMLDPLGIGAPGASYPCSSVIAYGSPNVLAC